MAGRGSTRRRAASLGLAVLMVGAIGIPPASAHFTQNPRHLGVHAWRQVIKQKVFTRKQANNRFYTRNLADQTFAPIEHDHDDGEFWALGGNEGTDPGTDFVGTTDDKALELHVNGDRALRLEPDGDSPNVIGGFSGNEVSTSGATIGGGGRDEFPNVVTGDFGTVSGGDDNSATNTRATVGGGEANTASGVLATVGGGQNNTALGNHATVGGGGFNSTSALRATVGGGWNNAASGGRATVGGGEDNQASGNWSFVGGGSTNTATNVLATVGGGSLNDATGQRSTVGGGRQNEASAQGTTVGGGEDNTASETFATVGGGADNTASDLNATVGGGADNTASGTSATVGGGSNNNAIDTSATVGGGSNNIASGTSATVGGGAVNTASGSRATVPGGERARATRFGEMAYASGMFAENGDAQGSYFVLRRTTTNATPTPLFLNGDSATQRLALAVGQTQAFDGLVAARSDGGDSAGYRIQGVIENVGGTTSFVGAPTVTTLGEDDSDWDVVLVADDDDDALVIEVTGAADTNIRWVATVRATQVAF